MSIIYLVFTIFVIVNKALYDIFGSPGHLMPDQRGSHHDRTDHGGSPMPNTSPIRTVIVAGELAEPGNLLDYTNIMQELNLNPLLLTRIDITTEMAVSGLPADD